MEEWVQCDRLNMLVTIDKRYLLPLRNMLDSYGRVHVCLETHVYIAHSSLDEEDIDFLKDSLKNPDIHIHNITITEKWFHDIPVLERLPEESFYRLMAFQYLPQDITRCLYLDPDIYIQKSLVPLYTMDMDGYYIAAASHLHGLHNELNKARLQLKKQERYVNSGIMLMNMEEIRKSFSVEKILKCLNANIYRICLGDQDMINILFEEKTVLIDECIYNLDERTCRLNRRRVNHAFIRNETAIIHYNGKYKPWLKRYRGILKKYYPYQDQTAEGN